MKQKIYKSDYRNFTSLVLENEFLKLVVLPSGGRVVSLFDKQKNREFLMQQEGKDYLFGSYDGDYVASRPAGFDDMFPTIDKCYYEDFPWKGHLLPDHGEVWGLNWDYVLEDNKIIMWVNGVRLPYVLKKYIYFYSDYEIRIDYEVTNLTGFDMNYIWSAHPIIMAEEGMEFFLPPECKEAASTLNFSGRVGGYGHEFSWPEYKDKDGNTHILNKFRGKSKDNAEKYFFRNKVKEGRIKLKYPSDNAILNLSFPPEKLPYIGILIDEGYFRKDLVFIIPEPCTAGFDRIDASKLYGAGSVLKANSTFDWYLAFSVNY